MINGKGKLYPEWMRNDIPKQGRNEMFCLVTQLSFYLRLYGVGRVFKSIQR